jgi:hypothetical protein
MKTDYPIPATMEHLPLDERGYPIPYFPPIVNGKPDFRYQDAKKRDACLKYKKCSVCGNPLKAKQFWFITGPMGLVNKIVSDAPMHEECARFSINVCPHIAFHKAERRTPDGQGIPGAVREKPDSLFLIRADKINTLIEQGNTYIKFRPVFLHEHIYQYNKLIPT